MLFFKNNVLHEMVHFYLRNEVVFVITIYGQTTCHSYEHNKIIIIFFCILREFTKSSPTTLQLDSMPPELLFSDDINFCRWTMILDDKSLKILSDQVKIFLM